MGTRFMVRSIVVVLICVMGFWGVQAFSSERGAEVAYTPDNLIRFHVIANSDTPSDQALKLKVRDRILAETKPFLADISDPREAEEVLGKNLTLIQSAAQSEVLAQGYSYPVRVEMGEFQFPSRAYGTKVLLAGEYKALRVIIGEGEGRNWWCVIFPPLCFLNVEGGNYLQRVQVNQTGATSESGKPKVVIRWNLNPDEKTVSGPIQDWAVFPRMTIQP